MEKMNRERSLTVSCSTRPRGDQIKLSSDRFRTSKKLYFFFIVHSLTVSHCMY